MGWGRHLDVYCERGSAALWAEPWNAVSNLAFVVAAVVVWRMVRSDTRVPVSVGFMAPLMATIGLGSLAFHTIATAWAYVLDVVPIGLFVLCYLAAFLRWFFGLAWAWCLLGVAAFVGLSVAFGVLVGGAVPNGSGIYVPVLLLLVGIAAVLRLSRDPGRAAHWPAFAAAGVVFAAALLARTADEAVCAAFPLGTHVLWHTLNGCLLLLVARVLVRRWRSVAAGARAASAAPVERSEGVR